MPDAHRLTPLQVSPILPATGLALLLAACVPSPTATPPRATSFPTLAVLTESPEPTRAPTAVAPAAPSPTLGPTFTPVAIATATAVASPTPFADTLAPQLQVIAVPAASPISLDQTVTLEALAADDSGLARLELLEEGALYSTTAAPSPPPRVFSAALTWKSNRLGKHHLRVVAYDRAGRVSPPVDLTFDVITDNRAPAAAFAEPIGLIDVPVGAPLVLQGSATDDVGVSRVDLIVDNQVYTYVQASGPAASPFSCAFLWIATTPGTHHLALRAHDTQDKTGDSAELIVNAVDTVSPAVTASYERDDINANGSVLVHALALSLAGVTRVELWGDDQLAQTVNSAAPQGQTVLDTDLVWIAGGTGDHSLQVRAYDQAGLNSATAPQVIHVRPAGAPTATSTPPAATATPPATPAPATATPAVLRPAPPTITLSTTSDALGVQLPAPVHLELGAHGAMELDQVELWALYQGEPNGQLLFADTVKGATDRTVTFDWTPTRAGAAFLFAQVTDQLGQEGRSPVLPVYLNPPAAPTPTPAFVALAGRWRAVIPTNTFEASFVQFGRALRGAFVNTPLNGSPSAGTIVAGVVSRDRVEFSVAFDPQSSPLGLTFECAPNAGQLVCNYQDDMGNRGSAIFAPVP